MNLKQIQLEKLLKYVGKTSQSPTDIKEDEFVELHFHSEHSALDGASRIHEIVPVVQTNGQTAIAITDHGTMSGIFDLYKDCKKAGVKLIPGLEAYIVDDAAKVPVRKKKKKKKVAKEEESEEPAESETPSSDDENQTEEDGAPTEPEQEKTEGQALTSPDWESHIILLPRNEIGYRNLLQIHFQGYVHRRVNTFGRVVPRIDFSILEKFKEGLVVASACLGGQINQALIRGADQLAEDLAIKYKNTFEHFYIELQPVGVIDKSKERFEHRRENVERTEALQFEINDKMAALAYKHNIPIIVTTDAHYTKKEDRETHALLLATQSKKDITDPHVFYFPAMWMMKASELAEQFPIEWIRNTKKIADLCEEPKYLDFGKTYKIPVFDISNDDEGFNSWLKQINL